MIAKTMTRLRKPEGRALIKFLRSEGIPFLAFRGPIPGVATGPHIHIVNDLRLN
jgi:hypothetical protein